MQQIQESRPFVCGPGVWSYVNLFIVLLLINSKGMVFLDFCASKGYAVLRRLPGNVQSKFQMSSEMSSEKKLNKISGKEITYCWTFQKCF